MESQIERSLRKRLKIHGMAAVSLVVLIAALSANGFPGSRAALLESALNAYVLGAMLLGAIVVWSVVGRNALRAGREQVRRSLMGTLHVVGHERRMAAWFLTCMVAGTWYAAAGHPGAPEMGVTLAITALALPEAWLMAF